MSDDNPIKRWTTKRKAAVVMEIFKGKTTTAEVARQYDSTVSEVEGWIEEPPQHGKRIQGPPQG